MMSASSGSNVTISGCGMTWTPSPGSATGSRNAFPRSSASRGPRPAPSRCPPFVVSIIRGRPSPRTDAYRRSASLRSPRSSRTRRRPARRSPACAGGTGTGPTGCSEHRRGRRCPSPTARASPETLAGQHLAAAARPDRRRRRCDTVPGPHRPRPRLVLKGAVFQFVMSATPMGMTRPPPCTGTAWGQRGSTGRCPPDQCLRAPEGLWHRADRLRVRLHAEHLPDHARVAGVRPGCRRRG